MPLESNPEVSGICSFSKQACASGDKRNRRVIVAEEELENSENGRSTLRRVMVAFAVLVAIAAISGLTLFLYIYMQKSDAADAESTDISNVSKPQLKVRPDDAVNKSEANNDRKGTKEPALVKKQSPELTRFEYTYHEIQRPLLANLNNSKKVMQVQIAIMTRYDDRVIANVKKHEFALRSVALDIMRKTTEDELAMPNFRKDLAAKIRAETNATLEKFEDFGGIEEIYFTSFVVQ